MLNPLGELHNAEENDNGTLRRIVGDIRVLAKQENIGLLLGHHTRKGVPEHGNPDAGRGASSISGVVRKAFTLYEMTEAEAAGWKIPNPRMFFRLDGAKANYDKKNATEWFERKIHILDNQDSVVAAVPWFPPCEAITDAMIAILMGIVEAGDMGKPWSKRLGKYDRSISRPNVKERHRDTRREGKDARYPDQSWLPRVRLHQARLQGRNGAQTPIRCPGCAMEAIRQTPGELTANPRPVGLGGDPYRKPTETGFPMRGTHWRTHWKPTDIADCNT